MPPLKYPQNSIGHLGLPLHKAVRMASSTARTGDTGAVTVFVTVPSEKVGEDIAGLLVNPEARLAACVNIIPGEPTSSSMHVLPASYCTAGCRGMLSIGKIITRPPLQSYARQAC